MENYKITDHAGTTLHEFEARHQAEAILFANTFDETHGLTNSKLWIKQDDGWWLAV
ncbi:hypothetical protein RI444_16520 [Paenarthrobacter sp. AT5]|uniref:hypothetical protein n=1 Tax=Paenarthrobacter TaxID=1742992 RepID=UPI001A99A051|nr:MULTISPECIES: hypothetical protein [Paenarthrobacter]WOC60103.1 hypothetical protein RI444_16520 [Paenarthrobacter sp. AT5]